MMEDCETLDREEEREFFKKSPFFSPERSGSISIAELGKKGTDANWLASLLKSLEGYFSGNLPSLPEYFSGAFR